MSLSPKSKNYAEGGGPCTAPSTLAISSLNLMAIRTNKPSFWEINILEAGGTNKQQQLHNILDMGGANKQVEKKQKHPNRLNHIVSSRGGSLTRPLQCITQVDLQMLPPSSWQPTVTKHHPTKLTNNVFSFSVFPCNSTPGLVILEHII